jgi:hypothetical protein
VHRSYPCEAQLLARAIEDLPRYLLYRRCQNLRRRPDNGSGPLSRLTGHRIIEHMVYYHSPIDGPTSGLRELGLHVKLRRSRGRRPTTKPPFRPTLGHVHPSGEATNAMGRFPACQVRQLPHQRSFDPHDHDSGTPCPYALVRLQRPFRLSRQAGDRLQPVFRSIAAAGRCTPTFLEQVLHWTVFDRHRSGLWPHSPR